ncbi:hypothetical protein FA407_26375, partial [Pseudomonas aeruginosa]|nr:hypothetical protein [Pseudomonas aeruginosa]
GIRHRGSTVPERSGVALSFCRRPGYPAYDRISHLYNRGAYIEPWPLTITPGFSRIRLRLCFRAADATAAHAARSVRRPTR